ncbi:MAG: 16S rRNA (cytosine(967)-C(5))-methyltransferase [Gomphosphaeria aponina SAG 52.96 = DSM 107014]|uniref:16S rRNA (cytosine(967)-C(5))-methyltransferase n=1 Tax=Gomphosphaeria aponina SAG 52.96 = DSM 107014 TaxID=1521640 RepID=A0A941GWP4_9CHRO|nr:16S rRNA (cytosine(967)-C(5))-methyltransferase [Gomphosphaeria aponina SAG 52.96 = DSM 107014]
MTNSRQLALMALREIYLRGAYTDIALDRVLRKADISSAERNLGCELVYGIVRRRRSLDSLIDQLGKKKAQQQPPDLRIILHIGLYQLRYLNQIPVSAAVNTSVELAKTNGLKTLSGVVNGLLRQYGRLSAVSDPLKLPTDSITNLGILHSFPDWIVATFLQQLEREATNQLLTWFNQTPTLDLRVNLLRSSLDQVESALNQQGINVERVPHLPQALRLRGGTGSMQNLPGFQAGWWTVQDSSAQLVTHLLDPQPGEVVIDACAAPGGKTTHIAELMGDQGKIWAGDRSVQRLQKVQENAQRLQLKSIALCPGDTRNLSQFTQTGDRVLLDAPCSGLGTLHKRPDIRWNQKPEKLKELSDLQKELLTQTATWVKPGGTLVYATCTLNPLENEEVIQSFLAAHPHWQIMPPVPNSPAAAFATSSGSIKIFPHQHQMDGFFMVKLKEL